MPHKQVQLERKDIAVAFGILTLAFVIVGILLGSAIKENQHAIELIQRSRIESCQRTYSIIKDVILLSANERETRQGGKLSPGQVQSLDRYMAKLDPQQCVKVVTPPTPKSLKQKKK